jgi:hypothetical protein
LVGASKTVECNGRGGNDTARSLERASDGALPPLLLVWLLADEEVEEVEEPALPRSDDAAGVA